MLFWTILYGVIVPLITAAAGSGKDLYSGWSSLGSVVNILSIFSNANILKNKNIKDT